MFSFNRTIRVLLILALVLLCGAASAENTLEVPASTRVIQAEAFANVKTARAVTLPEGIQEIHSRAFANSSITSINLPSTLTFIADDAFANTSLTTVTADKGTYAYIWASTYGYIIPEPSSMEDFDIVDGKLIRYFGHGGDVVIPNNVTIIDARVFSWCNNLRSVTIPNSVTRIGNSAFGDCKELENIIIPNSVKDIGEFTFEGCHNLKNVTIPNSVTKIGWGAFSECRNLTNLTIPNSVIYIGEWAFAGCSSLTNVTIPNSVTSIDSNAFENCYRLTKVTIPNSVTSIGEYAFSYCQNLKKIIIPSSVTSIGAGMFADCSNLTYVRIPKSVTRIDDLCFYNCSNLTNVTIPNGVTSIGWNAFLGCRSLTNVTIPDSVKSIDDKAFVDCDKLKKLIVKKGSYAETWAREHGFSVNYDSYTHDVSVTLTRDTIYIGAGQYYNLDNILEFSDGEKHDYEVLTDGMIVGNGLSNHSLVGKEIDYSTVEIVVPDADTTLNLTVYVMDKFKFSEYEFGVGETAYVVPTTGIMIGHTYTRSGGTYTSSNPKCALIDKYGFVTALKVGTSTIKYTEEVGGCDIEISCKVKIGNAPKEVTIKPHTLDLGVGEKYRLSASADVNCMTPLVFASDKTDTVTVDAKTGEVTAVSQGAARITATAYNGVEGACIVRVYKAPDSLIASHTNLSININETRKLTGIIPTWSRATIKYKSGNDAIAIVDNSGNITGVSVGKTTITMETYNSLVATCEVQITDTQYRAILIAQDHYIETEDHPEEWLPFITSDIDHLAEQFRGLNDGRLSETTNTAYHINSMVNTIAPYYEMCDEDDVTIILICGHGSPGAAGDRNGQILMENRAGLMMSQFAQTLSLINGTKIVFIASCGSGAALKLDNAFNNYDNFIVYTSVDVRQGQYYDQDHVAYLKHFQDAITRKKNGKLTADKNENGEITAKELAEYFEERANDFISLGYQIYKLTLGVDPQSNVDDSVYKVFW